ncbi:MAG: gamma-glutamyltransferase family protein [Chloroflexi bacterium]|nr:gamma-glutamyltransferase family protein [Chloroflexota bacterium]
MLREGGNAIDAYVTAVFLQNVVDFHQVSLFGAMAGLLAR